jgi:hypothetical protein
MDKASEFTQIERCMILCITRSRECTTELCKKCGWGGCVNCKEKETCEADK